MKMNENVKVFENKKTKKYPLNSVVKTIIRMKILTSYQKLSK